MARTIMNVATRDLVVEVVPQRFDLAGLEVASR
jgi:hypothetical protein